MLRLFPSLVGWHHVSVRDRRTAIDFAHALRDLSDMHFPEADKITLVLDNLNTHKAASLYNLNSAVGAKQSSGKLLMLNQCLCLKSSTMVNPFGEALKVNNPPLTD